MQSAIAALDRVRHAQVPCQRRTQLALPRPVEPPHAPKMTRKLTAVHEVGHGQLHMAISSP